MDPKETFSFNSNYKLNSIKKSSQSSNEELSIQSKEEKKNYHFSQFYNNKENGKEEDDNEESKEVLNNNIKLSKQISDSADMTNQIPDEPSIKRFENISPSELLENNE